MIIAKSLSFYVDVYLKNISYHVLCKGYLIDKSYQVDVDVYVNIYLAFFTNTHFLNKLKNNDILTIL